jgi:hypothetical protein
VLRRRPRGPAGRTRTRAPARRPSRPATARPAAVRPPTPADPCRRATDRAGPRPTRRVRPSRA